MVYSLAQKLIAVLNSWYRPREDEVSVLAEVARLNKLYLAYLRSVKNPYIDVERLREEARYRRYIDNVIEVVKTLDGLRYALHKFRRPLEHVSVDLDILIHVDDVSRAVRRLIDRGFRITISEPYTVTLGRGGFIIDLYTQPSFAWIAYMDGEKLLRDHVEDFEINGVLARGLTREAEVVVSAAHAVYKEHVVLLIDCLTLYRWFSKKVIDIAYELNTEKALDILAEVCIDIAQGAIEAPAKIVLPKLFTAYGSKIIADNRFRSTQLNIFSYLLRRDIGQRVLSRIIRRSY